MNQPSQSVRALAARARTGDEQARRQLIQALAPSLERIARTALGVERPSHPLIQQVRAVAERLGQASAGDAASLADSLGRAIAVRIHPGVTEVAAPTLLSA